MLKEEVIQRIALGEDSYTQFKREITSVDALAEEMCAFVNAGGGILIIGVDDDKSIFGISKEQEAKNEQRIISAIHNKIVPPVQALTSNFLIDEKLITVISVTQGLLRPYRTDKGKYLTKSGAGKRLLTPEEINRLALLPQKTFEELPLTPAPVASINKFQFASYFDKKGLGDLDDFLAEKSLTLEQLLNNLRLASGPRFTLPGLMFFDNNPQRSLPTAFVQAVNFPGTEKTGAAFIAKSEINGSLVQQYEQSRIFFQQSVRLLSTGEGFNNSGQYEIPLEVFDELMINALVHRDYSVNAPIQLFIYSDRVELTSPGALYNSLTLDNILLGIARRRNPLLCQFADVLLPFSGMGTGIGRSLRAYKDIEFLNDQTGYEFKAIVKRRT